MQLLNFNPITGTSYTDETIRQVFLSFLPKVGTQASVLLIRDLVTGQKLAEKESITLLVDLPFHLRYPTATILTECKEFLNLGGQAKTVQKTAILAYATMVGKACQSGACPSALLDEYVKIFFGRLRGKYSWIGH
jgi:GC-rich sequence DNA-binding factor